MPVHDDNQNPDMKTTRYFRDGNCYWKFIPGRRPKQKNGLYSKWRDSYFRDIDEFLTDPGSVGEVSEEEAEATSHPKGAGR
jgi:hypothetical protein